MWEERGKGRREDGGGGGEARECRSQPIRSRLAVLVVSCCVMEGVLRDDQVRAGEEGRGGEGGGGEGGSRLKAVARNRIPNQEGIGEMVTNHFSRPGSRSKRCSSWAMAV